MKTNAKNRGSKVNKLIFSTVAASFGIPLLAAVVLPEVYLPILGLTVPFLAAAFLEYRLENLGYRFEPHVVSAGACAAPVHV